MGFVSVFWVCFFFRLPHVPGDERYIFGLYFLYSGVVM